jgi:DNA-directed RNA polymerase specialized sigma24 family protein
MLEVDKAIEIIQRRARILAANNESLEYEDLAQESICTYLPHKDRVMTKEEGGHPIAFLSKIVENVAKTMTLTARQRHSQYVYTTDDVRTILEGAFSDTDDIEDVEGRSDVVICLRELPEPYRKAILSRYALGDIPKNGSAGRKRLDRAVYALAATMNNYSGNVQFVGTRRVMTNAHARAVIGNL